MQNTKLKSFEANYKIIASKKQVTELEFDPAETVKLYLLSESIDWLALEKEIVPILGSRSGPIVRLVCGTIYLQSFYELSSVDVIERWPYCPEYRDFCGFSATSCAESILVFPIPLYALKELANKLTGKGHDAMISALLSASGNSDMQLGQRTIH